MGGWWGSARGRLEAECVRGNGGRAQPLRDRGTVQREEGCDVNVQSYFVVLWTALVARCTTVEMAGARVVSVMTRQTVDRSHAA